MVGPLISAKSMVHCIRKDIDFGIRAVLGASIQKLVNTPFFEEKIVLNVDFRPWGCFCSPYAVSAAPRPF